MTHNSSSRHGFDFNVGEWVVTNRRLKQRGVGCDEWEVFEGYERAQQLLGGLCSIDEIDFPTRGTKGMTIRLYRPEADEWSIWWINSSDGVMQPPVHGKFEGTRGAFRGDDLDGDNQSRSCSTGRSMIRRGPGGAKPSPTITGSPGRQTGSWNSAEHDASVNFLVSMPCQGGAGL